MNPDEAVYKPSPGRNRLPALSLAALLALGIYSAHLSGYLWVVPSVLLAASVILYLFLRSPGLRAYLVQLSVFSLVVLCGFFLFYLHKQERQHILSKQPSVERHVGLTGHLLGPPWKTRAYGLGDRLHFQFQVEAQREIGSSGWEQAGYRIIVTVPDSLGLRLSGNESLAFPAFLQQVSGYANPGGFDWREYLAANSIVAEAVIEAPGEIERVSSSRSLLSKLFDPSRLALDLRSRLYDFHEKLYPPGGVSEVASAMLIGARQQVPRILRDDFVSSGTIHVLVVSGLHVGFIATVVYLLFSLISGRGWTTSLLSVGAVFLFALTSGARPSVLRASIMCAFVLMALPLQRRRVVLNSLAAAFAILLLFRPDWLFDIGFQLSFAAVSGIGLLVPGLEERCHARTWWQNPVKRWFARLVLASIAAQLAITPLVAYYFFRITPIAFIANLFMVPLAGMAVVTGFIADLAGFVWLPLAKIAATPAALILKAMIYLARFFADFPAAYFDIASPRVMDIFFFWLVLYVGSLMLTSRRRAGRLVLVCLLWANFHLWAPFFENRTDELLVRFLDLGRAQTPVLHFPGGVTILADPAGRTGYRSRATRDVISPYLLRHSGRKIDWLLLRGKPDARYNWAWNILNRFEVNGIIITEPENPTRFFARFLSVCSSRGVPVRLATISDTLHQGKAELFFIGVSRTAFDEAEITRKTDPGLIPVVKHNGRRFFLAGALSRGEVIEFNAGTDEIRADVLEWPVSLTARGSVDIASRFKEIVRSEYVIQPVKNAYGELDYYSLDLSGVSEKFRPLVTSHYGAVSFRSKEGLLWLSTERAGF